MCETITISCSEWMFRPSFEVFNCYDMGKHGKNRKKMYKFKPTTWTRIFFHYRIWFGEGNIDWNWMHFIYSYYEFGNSLFGCRFNSIEVKKGSIRARNSNIGYFPLELFSWVWRKSVFCRGTSGSRSISMQTYLKHPKITLE